MSRLSKLAIVATLMLATATGAMAATKKKPKMSEAAANSLASVTIPPGSSYVEPIYFQLAKGNVDW